MAHESGTASHSHDGSANPRHLNHPPPNKYFSLSIRPSRALGGLTVLLALAVGLLLSSALPVQGQETINYPEGGTRPVATFTATDPENAGAITWSLLEADTASITAGADFGDFEIDASSGVLTFAEVPDYEMPADDGENNEYAVTVVATDADGTASYEQVTVTVTNVDEAGR